MRRFAAVLLLIVSLVMLDTSADAAAVITETMRVVKCESWVSLREKPAQNSTRLKQVPLGAVVYHCVKDVKGFAFCQYEGTYGYILFEYLEPIDSRQYEFKSTDDFLTIDELQNRGEGILDWKEYNIRILACREFESKTGAESVYMGCYIDKKPVWAFQKDITHSWSTPVIQIFMGGKKQDPYVLLFDRTSGLSALDLLSGEAVWKLEFGDYPLRDISAYATGDDGTLYIAEKARHKLTAVSRKGRVLWSSSIQDSTVDDPLEIRLSKDEIEIIHQNGKHAHFDYTGALSGVSDE